MTICVDPLTAHRGIGMMVPMNNTEQDRITDSVDQDGNILAVAVFTPTYCAAFTIEGGELLETVEQHNDTSWNWDAAGICDPVRGDNPDLQAAVRATLQALTAQAQR